MCNAKFFSCIAPGNSSFYEKLMQKFSLPQIDQTDFGLDIEYLLKGVENPIVKAYLDYQIDVAVQFGADKAKAEKEMTDALEFEIGLAKVKSFK